MEAGPLQDLLKPGNQVLSLVERVLSVQGQNGLCHLGAEVVLKLAGHLTHAGTVRGEGLLSVVTIRIEWRRPPEEYFECRNPNSFRVGRLASAVEVSPGRWDINLREGHSAALTFEFDEQLVGRLLDDIVAEGVEPYVTRDSLRRMWATMGRLERALADGREIVQAATQRTIPNYNGWMISGEIGRYGFAYLQRAAVARGGYGNLPEESLYPAMVFDADGELLDGGRRYQLHFAAKQLPPVDGFWSVTVYNDKGFYEAPENAISVNNVTGKRNKDGSMTIHFGGDPKAVNYLRIMPGWNYIVRLYRPRGEILDGTWQFPQPAPVR